jgi:hypothetical protein
MILVGTLVLVLRLAACNAVVTDVVSEANDLDSPGHMLVATST